MKSSTGLQISGVASQAQEELGIGKSVNVIRRTGVYSVEEYIYRNKAGEEFRVEGMEFLQALGTGLKFDVLEKLPFTPRSE